MVRCGTACLADLLGLCIHGIGLQGVRIAMLQRAPVSLPGTLDSVVSMYAPGVRSLLTPLLTMGSLASSLVDDLCILLFAIGLGVLFCHVWTRS